MLRIGLTGMMGSGKSLTLKIFKSKGIAVVSADELVRSFQQPGNILWQQIRKEWGDKYFNQKGELKRDEIAAKILSGSHFRQKLEDMTHPLVKSEIEKIFRVWEEEGRKFAAAEVPLLFKAGWENMFDLIVMTSAGVDECVRRVCKKRKITPAGAKKWIEIQAPGNNCKQKSDIIIDTSGSLREVEIRAADIVEKIKEEKGENK
ncbi:MAG: dephospho-CoA kinase [Elusimicrobiota bacterium]